MNVHGHFFIDLNNFLPIWSAPTIFGVDKYLPKGLPKMKLANFTDPQKPPKLALCKPRRAILDPKIQMKFYSQNHTEAKMG